MLQIVQTPDSQNISRFAHDGTNLFIEFKKSTKVYSYANVPVEVYHEMIEAPSVGSFFHSHIKKGFDMTIVKEDTARNLGFETIPSFLSVSTTSN